MGGQFSCFVNAIYCLYSEEYDSHWNCRLGWPQYRQDRGKQTDVLVTTTSVHWDEEGKTVDIKLIRRSTDYNSLKPEQYDPIEIELLYRNGRYQYKVDGRDLCYAVAKAFTNTLKNIYFAEFDDFTLKVIPYTLGTMNKTVRKNNHWSYLPIRGCDHHLKRACDCGGEGEILVDFAWDYVVRCKNCKRSTYADMQLRTAIENWNKDEMPCQLDDIVIE